MQFEDYLFFMKNSNPITLGLDIGSYNHNGSVKDVFFNSEIIGIDYYRQKGYVDVIASGEYLPFREGVFDFISAASVLEHTDNPIRIIDEINRIKNFDTVVMISVPTKDFPNHFMNDNWRISVSSNPSYPCLFITNAPSNNKYRKYPLKYFLKLQKKLILLFLFDIYQKVFKS